MNLLGQLKNAAPNTFVFTINQRLVAQLGIITFAANPHSGTKLLRIASRAQMLKEKLQQSIVISTSSEPNYRPTWVKLTH